MNQYSTIKISPQLVQDIIGALQNIEGYGSVELYVQNNQVTQITVRSIKKTGSNQSYQGNGNSKNQKIKVTLKQ